MDNVKILLEARKKELLKLKQQKEKAIISAPEGTLRLNCRKNRVCYYHRTNPKDANGTYIKSSNQKLAERLAQKDYDQKVVDAIEKELMAIDKYLDEYPDKQVEKIYDGLHDARKRLITPIIETDEEYIKNWEAVQYQGKEFSPNIPEYYTAKGERVRSKSEVIIADTLSREHIPYRYEYPVYLQGFGKVHPDFTVLNMKKRKGIIWEHLGRMDDPEYAEKNIRKIEKYERNGFFPGENLILTYETTTQPLNTKTIQRMIDHYLK